MFVKQAAPWYAQPQEHVALEFPVERHRVDLKANGELYPLSTRKRGQSASHILRAFHESNNSVYIRRHGGPVGDATENTEDELIVVARKVPPEKRDIAIRLFQQLAERETTNRETALLRIVPNTLQEIAELEQVVTLGRARLLYQQKLEAIELPAGGFTNKKQADTANQLSVAYNRLVKLEAELGLTPTGKDARVTKGATLRSAYRNGPEKAEASHPKRAPRSSSNSSPIHHNFA
jgi:hypothetical protein